jgi:hypothetical protein
MDENSYRNEYKYIISPASKVMLSRNLGMVMKRDRNAIGKGYLVKSLYFDTMYDEALKDNLLGAPSREKFRIRCYNNDYNFIKLEKKEKHLNKGMKRSCALTKSEVQQIIDRKYDFLKKRDEELLKEFYVEIKTKNLMPKVIVCYFREPFLYPPGNVRVTLDYELRHSRNIEDFFEDRKTYFKEEKTKCVLEVKFDEFLPDVIRDMIKIQETIQTANSKYVTGRFMTG